MSRRNKNKSIIHARKFRNAAPVESIPEVQRITKYDTFAEYWPMGLDNLFPQALSNLVLRTPTLSAGIESKKDYTLGEGVQSADVKTQNWIDETDFNEQLSRLIYDDWFSGNAYLGISWNRAGAFRFYHWDTTSARIGRNQNANDILFFPDWRYYSKYNADAQNNLIRVPIWPEYIEEQGDFHSVIHISDYQPTYRVYGVPKYISALKSAQINYKSDQWNVSKIDNQFQPGAVLGVPVGSQEEATKVEEAIDAKKGPLKNGELLFLAKGMGGENVDLEILRSENEGEWLNVRNLGRDEIITALNWFSILLGQPTPGKLGQSQEIRNTYTLAMNTVIKPKRSKYLNIINKLLNEFGLVGDLTFNNFSPIDYSDKLDLNNILTYREALGLLGLTIDENRTDLDTLIKNGTNNSATNKG